MNAIVIWQGFSIELDWFAVAGAFVVAIVVGLIRFNPFNDGGGNFSFALALLDAHNTGVIITSMYGREQNRVYTKKIVEGECENQLTDEEIQAIELANSKFQEPKLKQK